MLEHMSNIPVSVVVRKQLSFFFFGSITVFCEEFYSFQGRFPIVSSVTSVCIFTQTANLMLPVPGETAPSHMLVHVT